MKIARVAVEAAVYTFDKEFDYLIPDSLEDSARVGCRVTVPFGNGNKKCIGIIFELCSESESKRLKEIIEVIDDEPLFNDEMIRLTRWIKSRTFCTLYEAAKAMLPTGINHRMVASYAANRDIDFAETEKLNDTEKEIYAYLHKRGTFVKADSIFNSLGIKSNQAMLDKLLKKGLLIANFDAIRNISDPTVKTVRLLEYDKDTKLTPKQQDIVSVLNDVGEASVKELCYFTGHTAAVINTLVKNGIAEFFERRVISLPALKECNPLREKITLTHEQSAAYEKLYNLFKDGKPAVSLLYGVTGSGKTSVYMSVIDSVIDAGKSVIVMVPEIGLTPQTLSLFCKRYGSDVAVFHSALSVRERLEEWRKVKSGQAKIVIGTRSAVFAPTENLGLIIVDEEQEHTYKSEQTPRYDAIDVAKFRAAYNNCLLVLASATPSVESYAAAVNSKYELCTLTKRYGKSVLPDVITVDMRTEEKAPGSKSISKTLYNYLNDNLLSGKQSILLINRRGFHTFAACNSCGEVVTCPYCSISMTYHSANNRLMCHYCGHSVPFSDKCPECNEISVRFSGFGTQKIEQELETLFPDAKIMRMDADSTSGKNSHEIIFESFAKGEYDILIGTQMIAKGLDFPNVTLVGVVSVDQQLYSDDFRSLEKTFSLLTQVVGRSGRGEFAGKAVIQTLTPENEIIRLAAKQDYDEFFNTEIKIRKALTYPPYCDLCVLGFVGEDEAIVKSASDYALFMLRSLTEKEYKGEKIIALGPMPARVSKISNKFRHRLIIKCRNSLKFREMISEILTALNKDPKFSKVTVYADINPDSTV